MPRLAAWVARHRRAILAARGGGDGHASALAATRLRINPTLDRLKSVTPAAVLEEADRADVRPAERGLRGARRGPGARSRCWPRTNAWSRAGARRCRGLALQPATALLPSAATQARRAALRRGIGRRPPRQSRASLTQAPRGRRLPRRLVRSVPRARCRACSTAAHRLTYEDYRAHGLGDLVDRFVVPDGPDGWRSPPTLSRPAPRRWRRSSRRSSATGSRRDADRAAARQPRAVAPLPAAVRARPGHRHADRRGHRRLGVSQLVAVAAGAAADRDRPGVGGGPAGAGRRRSSISSRSSRS